MNRTVEEDRAEVLAIVAVFLCFWFWAFPTWDKMGPPQTAASVVGHSIILLVFGPFGKHGDTHHTETLRFCLKAGKGQDKISHSPHFLHSATSTTRSTNMLRSDWKCCERCWVSHLQICQGVKGCVDMLEV